MDFLVKMVNTKFLKLCDFSGELQPVHEASGSKLFIFQTLIQSSIIYTSRRAYIYQGFSTKDAS